MVLDGHVRERRRLDVVRPQVVLGRESRKRREGDALRVLPVVDETADELRRRVRLGGCHRLDTDDEGARGRARLERVDGAKDGARTARAGVLDSIRDRSLDAERTAEGVLKARSPLERLGRHVADVDGRHVRRLDGGVGEGPPRCPLGQLERGS